MALANYTDLQAAVVSELWDRDDIGAKVPDWILMCEADLNSKLRVREMETSASITLTSGSGTLPTDYLAWRRVLTQDSPVRELQWAEPNFASDYYYAADTASALSDHFTIIGTTIRTYQTSPSNLTMHYYQKIPALVSSSTNWLLTRCPQIYLYGSLVHGAAFLDDDERIQTWGAMQRVAIDTLQTQDTQGRYGKSVARIRGVTP